MKRGPEHINKPEFVEQGESELTIDQIKDKLWRERDPSYLPTREELIRAFVEPEDRSKSPDSPGRHKKWETFLYNPEHPTFEVFTKEYIDELSGYLTNRAEQLGVSKDRPLRILEVGAYDGRLTHFLQERFKSTGLVEIVATDSGEGIHQVVPGKFEGVGGERRNITKQVYNEPDFPVERLNYQQALKEHNPDMVISSWMPNEEDWSKIFRATDSVKEYVLIGSPENSGHSWQTWGEEINYDDIEPEEEPPPYKVEGFERVDLDDLTKLQVSRMSFLPDSSSSDPSITTSFRRIAKGE